MVAVTREREKGEEIHGVSSVGIRRARVKVHLHIEGHTYITKRRDFTKYPKEEISGNQRFRARKASYPCYYASRGRVLYSLVYFYLKEADLNGFGLKGLFGTDLRGCLALFLAYVPYF